jgi:hypothetical protein
MAVASLIWSSLNDGELSPLIDGRVDMPQYMKGGKIMLNMLPTVQGPGVRRGGSRYINYTGQSQNPSLLVRFSRSQTESYILEFLNQQIRFYFNGGIIEIAPNVPYTVTTLYLQADLFNADGTPAITVAESADVLYLAHPKYPPQVLSFFGPSSWTLFPLVNVDGPWQDGNSNKNIQVYISAGSVTIGSTITLTATAAIFKAGHVGALFRLHQQDLTTIKPWEPGQKTPVISVGVQRRSGFNTYQCTNANAGPPPPGGSSLMFVQTGGNTLVHTLGNAWDGDQTTTIDPIGSNTYYSTGMQWSYQDCGYGVCTITGVGGGGTTATATITRQFPISLQSIQGKSWLWEMGAWNGVDGYPAVVTFFRQRLTFAARQRAWMSVVGDFANFADMDFGQVLPDSAVTVQCLSDQVNTIVYLSPADTLLVGTTGGEFSIGQQSISDPFGPENVLISLQSTYGGRAVTPVRVQQYTLFVQKNGRSLRESSFAFTAGPAGSYVSNDLTVLSEHITEGGIVAMAWARNPHTTIYMALGNGNLVSFTYNPEQSVKAWSRHDIAGGGKVVSLAVIPNVTGDWDDVYMVVRRTTNYFGSITTFHTIERLEQEYDNQPASQQHDMFYVDCGATLDNSINASMFYGPGALMAGSTDVGFIAGAAVFASTDVGRFIHYDYTVPEVGDDGLVYQVATTAVAQITQFVNNQSVAATILVRFPNLMGAHVPANGWRMTVTEITNPLTAWGGWPISILADGAAQPDQIGPFGGVITLETPASVVQCGLKSPSVFQTMKPEGGDRTGSSMGKIKRIIRATVRFVNTLGMEMGRDIDNLQNISLRDQTIPDDEPPSVTSGDTPRESFNGDWDRDGRVMIRQPQPLPLTLCAIAVLADVEEDG